MENLKVNNPHGTWRLASYQKVERRKTVDDRRRDPKRKGDRRSAIARSLRSLLRL